MNEQRSGDQVKSTTLTSGLITSLLAPWIHLLILWLEKISGAQLGVGYEAQVLSLVVVLVMFVSGWVRMRSIKKNSPSPAENS